MKEIQSSAIVAAVRDMCIRGCTVVDPRVVDALAAGRGVEDSEPAATILGQIEENARIAGGGGDDSKRRPLCQDTGLAVFFVDVGSDVRIVGGGVIDAINQGVGEGYRDGYLRKSVVVDPVRRVNTGDNTPAIVHVRLVAGDGLRIRYAAKGGGSENMSRIAMLKPGDGIEGVKDFVVKAVAEAGGNPCPPLVVGVGIGGDFEQCAILAKEALFRPLGDPSGDEFYAGVERELLTRINELGIGPMGLGGATTALAVHILTAPCHIASLPVAVNLNCHSSRHEEVRL
ncbi:MAG: fumarate hydratase [Phycisphaerae bacterium]|jgi:fumarate hydratase subunit alpha|nr:fumarate hydratase [Phycisphaerae bacterium]